MPILSPEFALFFLLFMLVYWCFQSLPKLQNALLLAANMGLLLYLCERADLPGWQHYSMLVSVVGFSALMTGIAAGLQREKSRRRRKYWLGAGVFFALGLLAFFKYVRFFLPLFDALGEVGAIFAPLGLSYYVFQSIAYLVSVHRGLTPALRWHELLLHFSFFLTITAGPIIRAGRFKSLAGKNLGATEQLRRPRQLLAPALAISLILLGTAKTWWFSGYLADSLVNPVFDNPMQYGAAAILLAIYGYTLQLFFDFSGYSDLVIGLALLLGFQLPWNFRAPLYAVNIKDFWARWHISLSTWIRDYIYIPLGGSRRGFWRTQINLLIALMLSGIWHGDTLNFLIWGTLHGMALVALNLKQRFVAPLLPKAVALNAHPRWGKRWRQLKTYAAIVVTFHFVCFAFVIFKVTALEEVATFFHALFFTPTASTYDDYLPLLGIFVGLASYPWWIRGFRRFVGHLQQLPLLAWFFVIILILQLIIIYAPAGIPGFIYANF